MYFHLLADRAFTHPLFCITRVKLEATCGITDAEKGKLTHVRNVGRETIDGTRNTGKKAIFKKSKRIRRGRCKSTVSALHTGRHA